jgi:haloacetate dehalogenase
MEYRGRNGVVHKNFDVLAAWREGAVTVGGKALDCGHYIPEEEPGAPLQALLPHLER